MIQIKRNNKVFFTLEDFGEGSKLSYQLMDHHYIILKFSTATPVYFEIGDSVEIPDFGYFELTSAYFPKHNESDGYDYEMQMDAYYMSWKNKLCKYRPQHGANETSFNLTTTVGVHMNVILGNLKALGLTYNGKDFSVDYTTYNNKAFDVQKRFLIEYGSISILDALNAICSEDALNCEWWIDGSIIYLGYCEMKGQTTFEQGVNVLSMSYSESKSTYITRLYAFGSDRNIPKGYFTGADADVTTDGVATDYLMLPNKEVDSDGFYAKDGYLENVNVVKNDKQAIEGVVMFEDEYPKVESAVSSIKTYDSTVDNEDGTKTTQTFWQVASTDSFTNSFKESWIKSNLTLGIKFTSGALMGMEFDVIFKVIDKVNYFEIVANDTYGRTLPDGVMCPNVGNKFFLYNWDATKITDTDLIPAAQLSLFDRAKQYYQKTMVSNSNFTCTMDGDKFYNGGTYDYHPLGEQVKLIHEMFPQMDSDGNHYRNSRIIGMDIKLDIPYDKPEYVVGEKAATSRLGKLEEKVDSITVNGLKIDGSAGVGSSVYVIGVNDMTPETDSNVYSARRTKKNLADIDKKFLRKDHKDIAQELITFLKGIKTAGIENDGNNITKGLTKLYDAIMSNGFKNSMTAGSGWQIDKDGNAQVESIEVRSYMRVLELVMNRLSAEESEFVFTESGTVETATLNEDGTYTLVMRKKTDKDITPFQQGDVLKGVVNDLAEPGAVGVKYYTSWMQVKEVNQTDNSIKVAVYADDKTPANKNFPPCNLMVLHRWGNTIDETRQSCWYISSIEKRIVMLDGVTQPKLEESNYASFYGLPFEMENFKGYALNKNQPYLYVRGAFLQDVCFIDYLGKVVKQERYRGVWSQDVANSKDPYIVTQTTFDTVYHNNAKWQCNSTEGTKEEPSVGTTDWTKLSEGGRGSDGKSAAKAYVTSNDIAIPTDANGIVTEDFQIGNTFSLMVDGKNCTDLQVTMDGTPATNAFKAQLNQLWLTISSSKSAEFGSRAYTLHFTVTGKLDGETYSDVVTILVRPNRAGADGKNLTRVSNFYKWGASGTEAPGGDYTENNIPEHVEGLDYLWNYEVCYNNAGETISTSEKTCIGNFARGIESITEYYQIGTAEKPDKPISVDTIDASGWQTIMPSLTAEKRYLWNLEVVRFTDGTYSISEVHLAGAQGESITIEQKLVYYAISASGTSTPPDSWFSDAVKEPTIEKPYLWTCVSIRYSDTTVVKYYTVARRGENGAPGRNLTKVVNFYRWGASGTQAPSDGYTKDNIPPHTDGLDYLWNYEVCYSDNDMLSQSGKACIGYFPKDGDPGKGIKSITEYYQVGTEEKPTNGITVNSNNELDTTGWKTSMDPTTKENRFVWNQEVIQFTDGTYSISVIHLAGAQGDQGVKGDKGEDAKRVYLESELPFIAMASNGIPKDARYCFSVYARLEHLTGTVDWDVVFKSGVTEITDIPYGEVDTYRYNGNEFIIQDSEVIVSMYGVDTIIITATLGNYKAQITIPVIYDGNNGEDGKDGRNGKPLVGPTEWKTGVRYFAGKLNEAYQSLVINPKYPKQMYLCGYTHGGNNDSVEPSSTTSVTSVNSCTKTKPWVQVAYQDFVATKVLFAERGKIENLDITNATIQGTITDMAVKTEAEWDAITNALVPKEEKDYVESNRNFQIVDPSKAGSYFIPTFYPTGRNSNSLIVFLPSYNPSTDYDIITCNTTQSNVKKRYKIPKYQTAGTHIRITKGGAPLEYSRWAYLEDAEYERLWTSNNGNNRNTIRDIYNMGTLICADHKIFKVTDGNDKHGHNITGAWYYGDSDYKHGRLSVNGTVARMLWLMPGQTVELVSQIEEIDNTKCLVWSVVNASDFTAVNINADLTKRKTYDQNFESLTPIEFHGESGILAPNLAGNVDNWEDCFIAHKKIDNLLLNGETKRIPSLFINRNDPAKDDDYPIAEFYIP